MLDCCQWSVCELVLVLVEVVVVVVGRLKYKMMAIIVVAVNSYLAISVT